MEQEQLTLYKLMILYLIEKVDFPLSNSQISEFILDKGYTNYFTVQRAFHELEEENMLRVKQIRNMSHYALSDEGSEAIEMFEYQIPNSMSRALSAPAVVPIDGMPASCSAARIVLLTFPSSIRCPIPSFLICSFTFSECSVM